MHEPIYRLPGFGSLVISLALVALLLIGAARAAFLSAHTPDLTATATPIGYAPDAVVAWVEWQSPRVSR